jgi:hypothetical protein
MTKYKVSLIKLTDDRFNGNHPNRINAGFTFVGYTYNLPSVSSSFIMSEMPLKMDGYANAFATSRVIEIGSDGVFKTLNSTYKYEIIDEETKD